MQEYMKLIQDIWAVCHHDSAHGKKRQCTSAVFAQELAEGWEHPCPENRLLDGMLCVSKQKSPHFRRYFCCEAWKWDIRQRVWNFLEDNDLADFPRPVHHRIPNFQGSARAGERLAELPESGSLF